MSMIFQYMPNQKTYHYINDENGATTNTTSWRVVGILSGALRGYQSLADLTTAGATVFPGMEDGAFVQQMILKCENGSGADGSAFYFATNKASAPADNDAYLVSGSGQGLTIPGNFHNLWLRKLTAGDEIILSLYW